MDMRSAGDCPAGMSSVANALMQRLTKHQHPFVMYAVLALGAAHLHSTTNLDLERTVQRYRSLAIQGLNTEDNFDIGSRTVGDPLASSQATAVLAACYALTFASSYMGDPVGQFLVLVRGCSSVTQRMAGLGLTSPFFRRESSYAMSETHMEVMRERLQDAEPASPDLVNAARRSLAMVEVACTLRPFERQLLNCMQDVAAFASVPILGISGLTYLKTCC